MSSTPIVDGSSNHLRPPGVTGNCHVLITGSRRPQIDETWQARSSQEVFPEAQLEPPDLDQARSAVLNSLPSQESQRGTGTPSTSSSAGIAPNPGCHSTRPLSRATESIWNRVNSRRALSTADRPARISNGDVTSEWIASGCSTIHPMSALATSDVSSSDHTTGAASVSGDRLTATSQKTPPPKPPATTAPTS
jgi:hypothetical protein